MFGHPRLSILQHIGRHSPCGSCSLDVKGVVSGPNTLDKLRKAIELYFQNQGNIRSSTKGNCAKEAIVQDVS